MCARIPTSRSRVEGNARSRNNQEYRTTHAAGSQEPSIMHRTRSRARNYNNKIILLHQAFCDYCSTIEGESELSGNKHRTIYQPPILYLHTGAVMSDLPVEECPTWKELHSSNSLQDTTSHILGT